MEPTLLPDMLAKVAELSAMFAGGVYVAMEFAVKPLTEKVALSKRKALRTKISLALSAAAPVAYLVATGAIPWAWALPVAAIAFGSSWLTHRQARANSKK